MEMYVVAYRTIVSKLLELFLTYLKVATATVCDIICIKNIPIVTQSWLQQQCGGGRVWYNVGNFSTFYPVTFVVT